MKKKGRITLMLTEEEYEKLGEAAALDRRSKHALAEEATMAYVEQVLRHKPHDKDDDATE